MKTAIKLFSVACVLALAACSDNYEYSAPEATHEGSNAVFDEGDFKSISVSLDSVSEFEVTVTRDNAEAAEEIPLTSEAVHPECFVVPTSVSFAAGETSKTIKVGVTEKMEQFTKYELVLKLMSNVYSEQSAGILKCSVTKEDYVPYANGYFTDGMLYDASWEQVLEYSATKDQYRFPNLYAEDYHIYFKWDGPEKNTTFYFCNAQGEELTSKTALGFTYGDYGMVYATVLSSYPMGYDAEGYYFKFPWQISVSAGSFGATYFYYEITQLY